jgi:hypothetical protein
MQGSYTDHPPIENCAGTLCLNRTKAVTTYYRYDSQHVLAAAGVTFPDWFFISNMYICVIPMFIYYARNVGSGQGVNLHLGDSNQWTVGPLERFDLTPMDNVLWRYVEINIKPSESMN